ncbi:MAG: hydrogenase maturation protease [Rubrivivax sp.]|jgi:hydrogenase maturation protease|nr:hydrogenase maturation protease [Rubrivivax sp.]
MPVAPLLILAVGNPSRGDDALGPVLVERLLAEGVGRDGGIELLTDFQLQVEHALDLAGRRAVLFVDAAWPCPAAAGGTPQRIVADEAAPLSSHALRPQAVLRVFERVHGAPAPPAWLLAIEGASFELGAPLSDAATAGLDTALAAVRRWIGERRTDPGRAERG